MSKHCHDIGMPWPFTGAKNTATASYRHAILRITHEEDNGGWLHAA